MRSFYLVIFLLIGLLVLLVGLDNFSPINLNIYYKEKLDRSRIEKSLQMAESFLINNQTEQGNFNYMYNFVEKTLDPNDSEVRQAGAFWGISLIYHYNQSKESEKAFHQAAQFFLEHTNYSTDSSMAMVAYSANSRGRTGTLALATLAFTEFLRVSGNKDKYPEYVAIHKKYIQAILNILNEEYLFAKYYNAYTGEPVKSMGHSPYFSGESLLALIKSARYLGMDHLKPTILRSAEACYETYVVEAMAEEKDNNTTKGFYQWGSMAYFEIFTAGWNDSFGNKVMELADWMIHTHHTLWRTKNTAYAYEGIIHAYEVAKIKGNTINQKKYRQVIDKGLNKLTKWQVNGPQPNVFLKRNPTDDSLASGGIMNSRKDPDLRIDVTQHQAHALILALKYVYTE